jgi:hypothetical protein
LRVAGDQSLLPLTGPVRLVTFEPRPATGAEDAPSRAAPLVQALSRDGVAVDAVRLPPSPAGADIPRALDGLAGRPLVVVLDHAVTRPGRAALLAAVPSHAPVVAVALTNPADLGLLPSRPRAVGLTLHDPTADAQMWLARALTGRWDADEDAADA